MFNSALRNTGDDALAVWANKYVKDQAVDVAHDNAFRSNTIQLPWRANGVAAYGGHGNKIENNLISDTMNYPGIMLATDHDPLPFSGQTLIANNGLYRTGGAFWNEDQGFGAITLFAQNHGIPGVRPFGGVTDSEPGPHVPLFSRCVNAVGDTHVTCRSPRRSIFR